MQTAAESSDLLRALEKAETNREEMKSLLRSTRGKTGSSSLGEESFQESWNPPQTFLQLQAPKTGNRRENEQNVTMLHSIQCNKCMFLKLS